MDAKKFHKIINDSYFLVKINTTEVLINGDRYSVVEKSKDKFTKKQMKIVQDSKEFNRGEFNYLKESYKKCIH